MMEPKHPDEFGYTAAGMIEWQRDKLKELEKDLIRHRKLVHQILLAFDYFDGNVPRERMETILSEAFADIDGDD